jgi:hypothetical protein
VPPVHQVVDDIGQLQFLIASHEATVAQLLPTSQQKIPRPATRNGSGMEADDHFMNAKRGQCRFGGAVCQRKSPPALGVDGERCAE